MIDLMKAITSFIIIEKENTYNIFINNYLRKKSGLGNWYGLRSIGCL